MQSRMTAEFVLQALLSAVLRRKPMAKVLIYASQGSQLTSKE